MKCQFCQRACRKIAPGMALSKNGRQRGGNNAIFWQCDYHGQVAVKYMAAQDRPESTTEEWLTTILVCLWKDTTYHVCFFYNNPEMDVKFRIDKVPMIASLYLSAEAIVSLDFLPTDITPENVVNKLPTYLLFS